MTIGATYRIQFHKGFTFVDAERIVPYLADLGISHLYASPVTVAQPGSTHGYDVVDPTRINPELGGEEAFRSLVAALRGRGVGLIIDIVPNHMGVAGSANAWWQDVLKHGPESRYARFFDINWAHKLLLPFLGQPLPQAIADGALKLKRDAEGLAIWAYDTHRFPIRPEDEAEAEGLALSELLERQHYRLAWWRTANDDLHWRRFFTITELAGLRVEDEAVFEETHRLYFRLWDEQLIDGVRIDHVDGLADPTAYLQRLRARMEGAYIVVEKILAAGEPLPPQWPVEGTSGYDFMEEVAALLHDPAGEGPLADHWADLSGRPAEFEPEEYEARRDMLAWEFEGQLSACVDSFAALAGSAPETSAYTRGMIRRAIRTMLWVFPVYRTYGTGDAALPGDGAIRETVRERARDHAAPGEMEVIEAILAWLAGEGPGEPGLAAEAVRRFQQLSAPIAAKAVEDTAFYRYGRLLSRNDVGFDPGRFAMAPDEFQARMADRRASWPHAMLTTATHDHKRGEDVRARLAVLSEVPDLWIDATGRWNAASNAGSSGLWRGDVYMLWQMLVGAWPDDVRAENPTALAEFRERIAAWQEKALREAKLFSSWAAPDADYEGAARAFLERVFDTKHSGELVADLSAFAAKIQPAGEANGLVQAFLRCTAPGVPDLYQGAEYGDLSLVDPDNRRAVDYDARIASLSGADADGFDIRKQQLIARILRMRRDDPAPWANGSWEPLEAEGERAGHVLAFCRRHDGRAVVGAVRLRCARAAMEAGAAHPPAGWWAGTRIVTDGRALDAAEIFRDAPVYLTLD